MNSSIRKIAKQVIREFKKQDSPQLSMRDAMAMTKVMTDGYEVYAIQKGDVTFLAWNHKDSSISAKVLFW